VFPVIVGTVMLTLMLTVAVVPLGVIAAIYMREYAHQGLVTSVLRIAINNLAGVPSIVYGMFGLGFFCYMLGGYIDVGPAPEAVSGRGVWVVGRVRERRDDSGCPRAGAFGAARSGEAVPGVAAGGPGGHRAALVGAVVGALWMITTTPYFNGAFAAKMPAEPTFGGRGILWASLTLALLTPAGGHRGDRRGDRGRAAGAMREASVRLRRVSAWQTITRIVLPGSHARRS
jgi:phosphate transport system permease protein